MKKIILSLILCLFTVTAFASVGDEVVNRFDGLTAQQQAEILKTVTDQVQQNKDQKAKTAQDAAEAEKAVTVDKVQQYSQLGASIGSALASTAKELGVVANDFLRTPVGLMAATLIVWKIAGAAVVHMLAGTVMFIVLTSMWWYTYKRHCLTTSTTSTTVEGKTTTVVKNADPDDVGGATFAYWVLMVIIIIASVLVGFLGW